MGTPFSEIYNLFLSQIKNYEILELAKTKREVLEAKMSSWLIGSFVHFHTCKKDLDDHDEALETFNMTLNSSEKSILARYMIYNYIYTYLLKEENLSQNLNSKDYRMYSPANQLKALQSLCEYMKNEASTLQSKYSWNSTSLKEMFKR